MEAFTIAFDITIVGALALPWVLLVIHLFFSDNENPVGTLLDWANKWVIQTNQAALASVLLFAMAYPLGSVVSRVAQDCFDDPDLRAYVFGIGLRVGVTERSIRADVYCQNLELMPGDFLAAKIAQFKAMRAVYIPASGRCSKATISGRKSSARMKPPNRFFKRRKAHFCCEVPTQTRDYASITIRS